MNPINSNRCKWPNKNWGLVNSYVISRLISRPSQMSGWVETTTADWITTAQFSPSDVDNSHARLVLAGVHEFPFGELQPGRTTNVTLLPPPPPPASPPSAFALDTTTPPSDLDTIPPSSEIPLLSANFDHTSRTRQSSSPDLLQGANSVDLLQD